MEKLAARSFARRIGLLDWKEVPVPTLRRQLIVSLGSEGRHCAHLLKNILQAELLLWLPEAGFAGDGDADAMPDGDLDLAVFISRLLIWDFYPTLLEDSTTQDVAPMRAMAELFAQRSDRCYLLFRSTINKLQQFLLAVN